MEVLKGLYVVCVVLLCRVFAGESAQGSFCFLLGVPFNSGLGVLSFGGLSRKYPVPVSVSALACPSNHAEGTILERLYSWETDAHRV